MDLIDFLEREGGKQASYHELQFIEAQHDEAKRNIETPVPVFYS
jgi:hypothetical protein